MANAETLKIECPYDDFAEEFFDLELNKLEGGYSVTGELVGTINSYAINMTVDRIQAEFKEDMKTLKNLSFEGVNQDGEIFGFAFEASPHEFDSGIGKSKSEVIGNRVFICSQIL